MFVTPTTVVPPRSHHFADRVSHHFADRVPRIFVISSARIVPCDHAPAHKIF
jgi:hypothetical protein